MEVVGLAEIRKLVVGSLESGLVICMKTGDGMAVVRWRWWEKETT